MVKKKRDEIKKKMESKLLAAKKKEQKPQHSVFQVPKNVLDQVANESLA